MHRDVRERCPGAWARLDVLRWDRVADEAFLDWGWGSDRDAAEREALAREWLDVRGWPVSAGRDVDEDGLLEAATEAAGCLQAVLHELGGRTDLGWAIMLHHLRWKYLAALQRRGGNRLAKRVERDVAPNGQPLAICVGGQSDRRIALVTSSGRTWTQTLGHVGGCGRTFPDLPFGPGKRWPTWCPGRCADAKSNAAARAETELKLRAANFY